MFRIVSEASVASGVRRIEAVTGNAVRAMLDKNDETMLSLAETVKATTVADVTRRVQQLMEELSESRRVIEQYKAKESASGADDMMKNAVEVKGLKVVTAKLTEGDAAALRQLGDVLRDKDDSVVAVMALKAGDKLTFQCVCGKAAVKAGVKAGDIIRAVTAICGGKGGGRPDSAMGGGNDASKCDEALASVAGLVADKVK